MQAHRQIYDDPRDTVPVPESMRHQRLEVIFITLEEPVPQPADMALGSRIAALFKDVPQPCGAEEELVLPAKEYPSAMTFE